MFEGFDHQENEDVEVGVETKPINEDLLTL